MARLSAPPGRLAGAALTFLGRFGGATEADLALRFGCPQPLLAEVVVTLVREGHLRRLESGPIPLLLPTAAGLAAAGLDRFAVPSLGGRTGRHQRVVSSLAARLERALGHDHLLYSERELQSRLLLAQWWEARAPRVMPGGRLKRPDLLLVPKGQGLPLGLEVELSRKSRAAWLAILRAWAGAAGVAGALYLAAPPLLAPLRAAVWEAGAGRRVGVVALPGRL